MDLRSNAPFWLLKSGIIKSYPSVQNDLKTDVVIIGAGISGALMAYELLQDSYSVTVVDARHVGTGSTAASTALLQYELDVPMHELARNTGEKNAVRVYKACRKALYDIGDICKKLRSTAGFKMVPSMQYATYERHRNALYREYGLRRKYGFDVSWLMRDDIKKMYRFDAPGGILSAEGAETDGYLLCHHLLEQVAAKGHGVYDNTNISSIERREEGVSLVTDDGHLITARYLIMACGYESLQYLPSKLAELHSTYAIISEPMPGREFWYGNGLIWETNVPYNYFRVTGDGRILVGGKDDPFQNPQLRDARLKKKSQALEQSFRQKFPHIPLRTDFAWAGTFAVTPDGLPYIGSIPQHPSTWYALAFGGNGITFSVLAAQIIRDALRKKVHPEADLFSFSR